MTKLAIDGGAPVRKNTLNYGRQWVDEGDIKTVVEVLRGDWLTMGPMVPAFEKAVADYIGVGDAIAVNSGTAALHAAAHAAKIGPDDEAVVSVLTFAASSNCILYMGGKPIFADVLPGTLNIDPADVERRITKRTKAIVAVDYTGQPCNHQALRELADKYHLVVIEDAAHALGATYKGQKVGKQHEMTTFSFHPVKHITTGEGGMIVTDDPNLAKSMRNFRSQGIDLDFRARAGKLSWIYDVVTLGFNYRLSEMGCALGLSQMGKLDKWLARRREIAACYDKALSSIPEIEIPSIIADSEPAWHLYVIKLNLDRLRVGRAEIFRAFHAEGIGVNVHYIPVPWHPYYQSLGYTKGEWPVAESNYERIISIPMFPMMTDQDVDDVIETCQKIMSVYRK